MGCPIEVLGSLLGHDDFVASHLQEVARPTRVSEKDPVKDLQCAWLLLLHCQLPVQIREVFSHSVWQCLATPLGSDVGQCTEAVRELGAWV